MFGSSSFAACTILATIVFQLLGACVSLSAFMRFLGDGVPSISYPTCVALRGIFERASRVLSMLLVFQTGDTVTVPFETPPLLLNLIGAPVRFVFLAFPVIFDWTEHVFEKSNSRGPSLRFLGRLPTNVG